MNFIEPPAFMFWLAPLVMLAQLAWYVGASVLLFQIWRKVRHLPG
jgi:hypothetical protein